MARKVLVKTGAIKATGELNDSGAARTVWQLLPIKGRVNLWGDEIYFPLPVQVKIKGEGEVVDAGALAYWPPGNAFCIFFGPTPASAPGEIRAASVVAVFGKVTGDINIFRKAAAGAPITIEKLEPTGIADSNQALERALAAFLQRRAHKN